MATSLSNPILVFLPFVEGDEWPFTDPSMVGAKLPPREISGESNLPKEFIVWHGRKAIALLNLGLKPAPVSKTGFLDEKIGLTIAMEGSDIPGERKYLFDQKIIYQEALHFVDSIVHDLDRIIIDIKLENLTVLKILEELGILTLPAKDPIGKEAIYSKTAWLK